MKARVHIHAAGLAAPGLVGTRAFADCLSGAPYSPDAEWQAMPGGLSRRQAARMSDATRLAIVAAEQVGDPLSPDAGWVFASSTGEGNTLHEILTSLRAEDIMIQPLRFQNAVHNAAQGQWSILAGGTGPMTSIAAYDETAGAGLLKAVMQALLEGIEVGLVLFDAPLPMPLHEKRPFALPLAAALALGTERRAESLAVLDIALTAEPAPAAAAALPETLAALADSGNPAAALLPLIAAVLEPAGQELTLPLPGGSGLGLTVREAPDAG